MKFKKKTEVLALIWDNRAETLDKINEWGSVIQNNDSLILITDDGDFLNVKIGDYIVKSIDGTFKCSKEYFEKAYEKIEGV
jgi:hypothetical protein